MARSGKTASGGPDEAKLVRRAKRGDVEAFAELVRLYQERVWRFLATWVPEPDDREDLVQEVFMAAYQGIGKFRGEARFSTWLLQIAINQARGHRRKLAQRPRHVALPDHGDGEVRLDEAGEMELSESLGATDRPDEVAARQEISQRVWGLIERLPEEWQAAMRLRYLEELTHPEIAEVLEVPVGTVKAQLHRGRQRLALWLEEEGIA